ncbi:MAG TPA: hypothetical protein VGM56_04070 [Byssovorax sp.]|jgi:hypothetical protein
MTISAAREVALPARRLAPPIPAIQSWIATAALVVTSIIGGDARADAPAPAPAARPYGPLEAGGLTPPPPLAPDAARVTNDTERALDASKRDDSKRGLTWVAIEAQGGFEHRGLQSLSASDAAFAGQPSLTKTTASGAYAGGSLSLRLLFFTVGAEGRASLLGAFRAITVGGVVGAHLPFGRVEPSLSLGGGFASLGGFKTASGADASGISMGGAYGRATLGFDVYAVPALSIGARFGAEFAAVSRAASDTATLKALQASGAASGAQATALGAPGSSVGGAIDAGAALGLHF